MTNMIFVNIYFCSFGSAALENLALHYDALDWNKYPYMGVYKLRLQPHFSWCQWFLVFHQCFMYVILSSLLFYSILSATGPRPSGLGPGSWQTCLGLGYHVPVFSTVLGLYTTDNRPLPHHKGTCDYAPLPYLDEGGETNSDRQVSRCF